MATIAAPVVSADHEEVRVIRGGRSGLTMAVAVHRTVAGRSLGGCRIWSYAHPDDAVRDVERLARSMTFKAACAGLALGGGKGVIAVPPGETLTGARRHAALEDFAELVESFDGRYITAQDVGTSVCDLMHIAQFTRHVTGRPRGDGGAGDPSPSTALGVEVAIRAALEHALRDDDPRGRTIVVLGLGHVGGRLATRLARAGARLVVSDIDPAKRALADKLGARWVAPEDAPGTRADVFAPCALGGVIDRQTAIELPAPIVAGAANNQLASEPVAELLRARRVLYAPDFIANAGGLIAMEDELRSVCYDARRANAAVRGIGRTLRDVFARADAAGTTTLAAAHELAAERLAGATN
jgi:leucine dehydrogenase